MTQQEAMKLFPCQFYQKGNCRYEDYCKFSHEGHDSNNDNDNDNDYDRLYYHHDDLSNDKDKHNSNNNSASTKKDIRAGVDVDVGVFTCGICLEDIVRSGKRFGLLSGCSHCFCIDCLPTWRRTSPSSCDNNNNNNNNVNDMNVDSTDDMASFNNHHHHHHENARSCPQCRKKSDFTVPSSKFCLGNEKQKVIGNYKQQFSQSPCKYFDGTLGSCPFGRNCFYTHWNWNEEGEDLKS